MDDANKITWDDNNEDLTFSSLGTCDAGYFVIEAVPVDGFGYVVSFADAPMGIVDGKRVEPDGIRDLTFKYVAGGGGENETWARHSGRMRATKHLADDCPEVEQPAWWETKPPPPTQATGNATGETAPADDNAPTPPASSPAGEGHNAVNALQVRTFVERIERLNTQKSDINEAIKEVYAEAEAYGHPGQVLRKLIQLRKVDPERLAEFEGQLTFYRELIGI